MTGFDDRGVLHAVVELKYDGKWNDITDDLNMTDDIVITRGRSDEASTVDTSTCTFRLNNTDGKYSPRNPGSPLYRKIGTNTPVRIRIPGVDEGVRFNGLDGSYIFADDSDSLEVTSGLDVRIDVDADSWRPPVGYILAAKYRAVNGGRSWVFFLENDGSLGIIWSSDGTTDTWVIAWSTTVIPEDTHRLSVRATVDFDGSGGFVVRFYTAASMSGSWTEFGDPVEGTGSSTIFGGDAELSIGSGGAGSSPIVGLVPFSGVIYSFELRDGVDGNVLANPVFGSVTDLSSFTDSAGVTWSSVGNVYRYSPGTRFYGYISAWPSRWDYPEYASVPIEANGILRRLGQGTSLRSAMVRGLMGSGRPAPVAYWTCEGGKDSTVYGSEITRGYPMQILGAVKPATYDGFDCSDAIPAIGTGLLFGPVPDYRPTDYLRVMALVHVPDTGVREQARLMRIVTTGDACDWSIDLLPNGNLMLTVDSGDRTGNPIFKTGELLAGFNGHDVAMGLYLIQQGADLYWQIFFYKVNDTNTWIFDGTLAGHRFGTCRNVTIGGLQDLGEVAVGHVVVFDNDLFFDMLSFINAWKGDTAEQRISRLCTEENVPLTMRVTSAGTEQVGAQRIKGFVDLVQEAAEADEGILYEPRDTEGIAFRSRASMYRQKARLALDYSAGHIADGFEPIDDDQDIRNDVTVTRTEGSSARSVEEFGRMSVLDPPDGVGRYTDQIELNVASDDQLPDHAGWRRHLGTVDEFRYPKIHVSLTGNYDIIDQAISVDIGDRLTIDNLPSWMPPGRAEQIVQGYTETINTFTWDIVYNCTPASPWDVAYMEDPVYNRADTVESKVARDASATDTSIDVFTTRGDALWTTKPEEFPFDVDMAGEQVTVSSIISKASDEFARTVSGGWGSTDTGQDWGEVGADASAYSVNGSSALLSLSSVNTPAGAIVGVGSPDTDQILTFTVPVVAAGPGGWLVYGLIARYQDPTNCYNARAEFKETGKWGIALYRGIGPSEVFLQGAELDTYKAGDQFTLRLKLSGTRLLADLWKKYTDQPVVWRLDVQDTAITGNGDAGVFANLLLGNTNTLPVTATFDRYEITNPQTFTVTRAVNGISKPLPVGSDVRILHPAIVAL